MLTFGFSSPAELRCKRETNLSKGMSFGCFFYTVWIVFRSLALEIISSFGTVLNNRAFTSSKAGVASGDFLIVRYSLNVYSFIDASLRRQYRSSDTWPERML